MKIGIRLSYLFKCLLIPILLVHLQANQIIKLEPGHKFVDSDGRMSLTIYKAFLKAVDKKIKEKLLEPLKNYHFFSTSWRFVSPNLINLIRTTLVSLPLTLPLPLSSSSH